MIEALVGVVLLVVFLVAIGWLFDAVGEPRPLIVDRNARQSEHRSFER